MSDYLLPGLFDNIGTTDESILHQAGLDSDAISQDSPDVFGNDPIITPDDAQEWSREHLPQFGPPFVRFVHEHFSKTDKLIERLLAKWAYEPQTVVFPASMQSDGSGNVNRSITGNAVLYEPPPGFTLALHRLSIMNEGNTFGAPFNAVGGYWELRVNDEFIDGASLVTPAAGVVGGQFPVVNRWGTRDAPRVRDGEVLSIFISGGPVGKKITIKGQGTLERQAES